MLLDIKVIWFGYIAHLSQWGGGGILPVQMISSSFATLRKGGGEVSTLWSNLSSSLCLGWQENFVPKKFGGIDSERLLFFSERQCSFRGIPRFMEKSILKLGIEFREKN